MMKIFKSKIFLSAAFIVLLCVSLGLAVTLPKSDSSSAPKTSGSCGDKASWAYYEKTGELKISGSGEMEDFSSYDNAPWNTYRRNIISVTIAEGITGIGDYAFSLPALLSIEIPSSVKSIGNNAFLGCHTLLSVTLLPQAPVILGENAFGSDVAAVYVPSAALDTYKTHKDWAKYRDIIIPIADADNNDFIYGDANGDGNINATDVLFIRKHLVNYNYETGSSIVAVQNGADVNGDGAVTALDVLTLRVYLTNYNYQTGKSSVVLGPQS